MSLAKELVEKFNMKDVEGCYISEDKLLINGWICIRVGDVYKKVWDNERNILFITEEQQDFFEKHKNDFNARQLADIEMLLKDFGNLYKYHNDKQELKGGAE
jgi:hypothetical protein